MEVSSKEDAIQEHSRKDHISSSYSSTGPITRPLNKERLAVIEEGGISKVNADAGSLNTRGEYLSSKIPKLFMMQALLAPPLHL